MPALARSSQHRRVRACGRLARALVVGLFATVAGWSQVTAPAYNWQLPVFTPEGYRTMLARGTQARMSNAHQFDVLDLNLTMFSGDASSKVENVILSPAATFLPQTRQAHGENSVRFIGQGVEAIGTRWVYYHDRKKISLDGNVRVTFDAEVKNLLK